MSEKFENHEVNEQNLEKAAGGKSSGGVAYICSNCRALVWDYGHDDGTPPPQVKMIHCPECGRLCDGHRR